jgi:hypothetical protein
VFSSAQPKRASVADELRSLAEMRRDGLLDEGEFEAAKRQVLASR